MSTRHASAFRRIGALVLLVLMAPQVWALDAINTGLFGSTAIKGYDPVTYHSQAAAVEGSSAFTTQWMGATWRFASAENRDLFVADPERYAPQYGGYCAYAVGNNYTAGIDPTAFSVVGDKLYLNYSHDIQKQWLQDRDALIASADVNWPTLRDD